MAQLLVALTALSSILGVLSQASQQSSPVTLNTTLGVIVGYSEEFNHTKVDKFKGIPYAKPPIGPLRFARPVPYGKWDGTLNATTFGNTCPQLGPFGVEGAEDCLTLNIYIPPRAGTTRLSVMLWLYGGGFTSGAASSYNGEVLATKGNVIVVTVNYRVNAFGFLTTNDKVMPGNMGLWDQHLAIRWVHDNIMDYGGDPASVTLFGESAGGRSVSFQMFSPMNNETLFQRVIAQSGSALSLTYINRDPMPVTSNLSEALGCSTGDSAALLGCLQEQAMVDILHATSEIHRPFPFFPIVDGDFLPYDLGDIIANATMFGYEAVSSLIGNFAKYDYLAGFNSQDGLMYIGTELNKLSIAMTGRNVSIGVDEDVYDAMLQIWPFTNFVDDQQSKELFVDIAKYFYQTSPYPSISSGRPDAERRLEWFMNISGHMSLMLPVVESLIMHSALSNRSSYCYEFDHKRSDSHSWWYEGPDWLRTGADHADDVPLVFGQPFLEAHGTTEEHLTSYTNEELALSDILMFHWSQFAKYGSPGNYSSDRTWPVFAIQEQRFAHIRTLVTNEDAFPLAAPLSLWRSFQTSSAIIRRQKVVSPTEEPVRLNIELSHTGLTHIIDTTSSASTRACTPTSHPLIAVLLTASVCSTRY